MRALIFPGPGLKIPASRLPMERVRESWRQPLLEAAKLIKARKFYRFLAGRQVLLYFSEKFREKNNASGIFCFII
jgi:hypothetical protein